MQCQEHAGGLTISKRSGLDRKAGRLVVTMRCAQIDDELTPCRACRTGRITRMSRGAGAAAWSPRSRWDLPVQLGQT